MAEVPGVTEQHKQAYLRVMAEGVSIALLRHPHTQPSVGPPIRVSNNPLIYLLDGLMRPKFQKLLEKGHLIPWPRGQLPHFLSALSLTVKFHSREERRKFYYLAEPHLDAAKQYARQDLEDIITAARSGQPPPPRPPFPLPQLPLPSAARFFLDTSRPEGNINTMGDLPHLADGYDSLSKLVDSLRAGDALGKTDLAGAFPSLRGRPGELPLMGCAIHGHSYIFPTMTLGCKSSPGHFESLIGCPIAALCEHRWRQAGVAALATLTKWVDDYLFRLARLSTRNHVQDVLAAWPCLMQAITAIGASAEPTKTTLPWRVDAQGVTRVNTTLDALGFVLNTLPEPSLSIPAPRKQDILFECQRALRADSITYADLESLVGKMGHVALAIAGARAFISSLRLLLSTHRSHKSDPIALSAGARDDLRFFAHAMLNAPARILIPSEVSIPQGHLMKDAATGTASTPGFLSVVVCGLTCVFAPPGRSSLHIGVQELVAETLAAFVAAALWRDRKIATTSDNANNLSWQQRQLAHDDHRNALLKHSQRAQIASNLRFEHEYIPSRLNVMADAGTHLNVANGQRGLEEYLSFLQASGAARPDWWPPDFTYPPPRTMRFFLVDPDSALGRLADTLVRPEAALSLPSGPQLAELLRSLAQELNTAAHLRPQ